MINEDNLKNLYAGIVAGDQLTTKNLNSYGFNSKDLNNLIEQGSLTRIKKGYYSFLQVDDLFYYGKKLIAEKDYEKAKKCFLKCYELDHCHYGACFQLFFRSIVEKDYENIFKYFDAISNTYNKYFKIDNNFYLYLLNIITDIPEKYKEYVKTIKFEDIRVDFNDTRYKDVMQQNRFRTAVLQGKFSHAMAQLNKLITINNANFQLYITKRLLQQVIEVEQLKRNTLTDLVKNEQYLEAINFLEEKSSKCNINFFEKAVLNLIKTITNFNNSDSLSKKTVFESENLFEAIEGNNYELALDLCEKYITEKGISDDNIIYLLLKDICNKISFYNSKKDTVTIEQKSDMNYNSSFFSDLVTYLKKSDLENAIVIIRKYLKSINKEDHEFLIVDLIKLSLIENDLLFKKPIATLKCISDNEFDFEVYDYIQKFYEALSQNKFTEARIHLDIISNAKNLNQECLFDNVLVQVLDNTEKLFQSKKSIPFLNNVEESIINNNDKLKEKVSNEKKENSSYYIEEFNNAKNFIEKKHEQLLDNQGIIILKPMDIYEREIISNIVKNEYRDIFLFTIGRNKSLRIVLCYKPYIDERIDYKALQDEANLAYSKKDYNTCINIYLKLLQINSLNANIYAKLGLAYMQNKNREDKEKAIDYLTIATELCKQGIGKYDFTELIASLRGICVKKENKPFFKMEVEDFNNDLENNYGIENIDEITEYILNSRLDVESACHNLNLSDEQIDIIKLIYARKYYSQGNYEKGDQFLKSVERSKHKTKFTKKLYEEVIKNKKFYINRINGDSKKLVLTIQPKGK